MDSRDFAGAVGEEETDIMQVSLEYFKEADNARRPLKKTWDRVWDLYNNYYDYSKKASWQSKGFIPKISGALRVGTALLKKALIRAKDFFTVETSYKEYQQYTYPIVKNLMMWVNKIGFVNTFVESLTAGMLSSLMVFKVYWKTSEPEQNELNGSVLGAVENVVEDKKSAKDKINDLLVNIGLKDGKPSRKGELRIVAIDPFDFWLDPSGRNKYQIHRILMDLADIVVLAEDPKNKYEKAEIDLIKEDFRRQELDYQKAVREGKGIPTTTTSFRKQVEVMEYWGDIMDGEGRYVHRNVTWSIANMKYIIRKPIANPFDHGMSPFVWGPLVLKPFSVYHKGFFEDGYAIAYNETEIMNMALDTNAFAGAKAFEIDLDIVYNPEEFKNGIYPGKVYRKRTGGQGQQMIRELSLGNVNPQLLRLYQEIDREWQNSTGLTEFITGKPATRGRPTATETVTKGQQAQSIIEDLATDMEEKILSPLFERAFQVCFQYQRDFTDPVLKDFADKLQMLAGSDVKERRRILYDKLFLFKVSGLSTVLAKAGEMQKAMQFLDIIGKVPQFVAKVNVDNILAKMVDGFNWDAKEVLLPEGVQNPPPPQPGQPGQMPPGQGGQPPPGVNFQGGLGLK